MKKTILFFMIVFFFVISNSGNTLSANNKELPKGMVTSNFSSMPLVFTENHGQFGEKTLFQAQIRGSVFLFSSNEVQHLLLRSNNDQPSHQGASKPYQVHNENQDIKIDSLIITSIFIGSNPDVVIDGLERLSYNNNYFLGRNSDSWWTNVPNYSGIIYRNIYPGIDLQYYWKEGSLKYDFIINSGADINQIKIKIEGAENITITEYGDLAVKSEFGTKFEKAPVCYQEISNVQHPIRGRYELLGEDTFGFTIDNDYDLNHDLIIDPQLVFSTYIYPGRGGWDQGIDLAIDSEGSACITGKENNSIFVTKFTNSSNIPVFFTNIGGNNDVGAGIAIDLQNNIVVTGITYQVDFPMVNAYDDTYNGDGDAFLLKLSPMGDSILFSTYFGGALQDSASGAVVDNYGNISIAGFTESPDLPAVNGFDNTHNGAEDGFVAEFNSQGNALLFCTYLGGNSNERINDIAVDQNGDLYLTGTTGSRNFPTVNAFDDLIGNPGWPAYLDAFVTKLSSEGDFLVYSTYLGAGYRDYGYGIAVDTNGSAYVTGENRYGGFPLQNPYDSIFTHMREAFVTKFSPAGNELIYSTYLGGDWSVGERIAVDQYNCAYVTGFTGDNFPLVNPIDSIRGNTENREVFLSKFTESGECLLYSSYFGGDSWEAVNAIAVSDSNELWITGWAGLDLPLVNPYDSTFNSGYWDPFLARFVFEPDSSDLALAGSVTDAYTGYPIPDVQVYIVEIEESFNTDSLGEYNISAICAGFYTLEFSHIEYIDTIVAGLNVVPGELTVVDISMWRNSAITGVVRNEASVPIENAIVTAMGTAASSITDSAGAYYINNILPGLFDVSSDHNDYCDTVEFDVEVNLGQTTYVDLTMFGGGYLAGIVTDSVRGNPVEGVLVSVDSQFAFDTTDQTGSYFINGICPGTIDISFEEHYYIDKVIEDIVINYGDTSILDVQLSPLQREVEIWYGNPDGSPIEAAIGERFPVDVYIQTADTLNLRIICTSLLSEDRFFDSLLSDEGQIYYPLDDWEFSFKPPYNGPELPPDWTSLSIFSWCYECGPNIHFEEPTKIHTFMLKTVFDLTIIGDTVECLGAGYYPTTGYGSKAGDFPGVFNYPTFDYFSPVVFTEPLPPCLYVVGDINGSDNYNGLDITYGVAFFKGGTIPACYYCELCPDFHYCGDVNASCSYNGLDITYGVAYFKGGAGPAPCGDCPPSGVIAGLYPAKIGKTEDAIKIQQKSLIRNRIIGRKKAK